jgi:hypothetical protein
MKNYLEPLETTFWIKPQNFLRQYTYREYYEDTVQAFTDGEELLRLHLGTLFAKSLATCNSVNDRLLC